MIEKIWTDLSSILSQSTRLTDGRTDIQTDRQTDAQTIFSSLDRVCISCSAVKILIRSFPFVMCVVAHCHHARCCKLLISTADRSNFGIIFMMLFIT